MFLYQREDFVAVQGEGRVDGLDQFEVEEV